MKEKVCGVTGHREIPAEYMVGQADRVIAVYDGREKGGTVSTIRMVHAQRKEMREIPVGPYLPESMINLGYFRNASGR